MVQGPGQHSSVIRTALIAVFMACALAGQAAWASGETDAALQAYRDGNYPAAIKIWRKLAANDNPMLSTLSASLTLKAMESNGT